MQLKTADHKYSNVMQPFLNPDDVTIPPNDNTVIPIQSQLYAENAVTGILQQSDRSAARRRRRNHLGRNSHVKRMSYEDIRHYLH